LVFPVHPPSSYTFAASALSQPISKSERHISVQLTNFDRTKSQHFEPGQPIAVWERLDETPESVLFCASVEDLDHSGPVEWVASVSVEEPASPIGSIHQPADDEETDLDRFGMPAPPASGEAREEILRVLRFKVVKSDSLSEEQKERAFALLSEFASCFSDKLQFPGQARLPGGVKVEHRIDTQGKPPVREPPRRMSEPMRQVTDKLVRDLLENGAIEPSQSPYAAPVVIVKKKDGSWRCCIDYRRLNRDTKKDAYPLPRIDDILDRLGGVMYFSKMDATSAYHQIPIAPEDREKTAFATWLGIFQWIVMPLGLTNAPPTFQRFMDVLLSGLNWKCCIVYLDDIIVFSRSFEEHLEHLRQVLTRIRDAGVVLKPSKCEFFCAEMSILGHVVGRSGIKTDPAKTAAVMNTAPPRDVPELRHFLGLAGYYRRFVKDFAEIAEPLDRLTRANQPWVWGPEQQRAFDELKQRLASAPVLRPPDFNRPFILFCDASSRAIACVLSQKDDNGEEYVVSYGSKRLSSAQCNYSATERECLAIVHFVQAFRPYLEGGPKFIVVTDHSALKWLMGLKAPTGRLARWALLLQSYDFDVVHRPGRQHINADSLTRLSVIDDLLEIALAAAEDVDDLGSQLWIGAGGVEDAEDDLLVDDEDEPSSSSEGEEEKDRAVDVPSAKSLVSPIPDLKRLQSEQLADPELRRFIGDLRSGASSVPEDLHLKDGVLWHTWTPPVESGIRPGTRWQVVLPSSQRDEILAQYHDENGHGNAQRTLHQIREKYWWPRMFEQIRRYVASCDTCQRHAPKPRTKGTYRAWVVRDRFQEWHVDIAGPLPESSSGNRYFVTCVDAATGEPVAEAIRQADAESVVRVLKDRVFLKHGPPSALLTDRGAQFMGNLWDEVARRLGTKLKFTSPFRPSTNGRCERMNGTIKNILKRLCGHLQRDWDLHLQEAVCSILHAPNRTLKEAPYFLVYGQEPRFALEQTLKIPSRPTPKSRLTLSEEGLSILESMDKAMELVYRNVREAQRARQLAWDQSHKNVKFEMGSEVLYWRPVPVGGGEGRSTSLAALWSGPYRIEKATGPLNYRIVGVDNPADTHVVHVSRLKPYVRRQSDSSAPTPADHFEIEDILDQRSSSEGIEYLVKWRGFSHRYNSWVRREDLAADELLERFERERAAASSEPQIASNPRSRSERTQEALSPQTSDKGRVRRSGKSTSVPTSAPSEPPPLVSRSDRVIKPPSRLDL
jgi:transposase InsO family protein